MKPYKLIYLLIGLLFLGTAISCNANSSNITSTNNIAQSQQLKQTKRSVRKTVTISVEGEKTQIPVKLYQYPSPKFSTYFPEKDFIVDSSASGEGAGIRFYANFGGKKNENAYIHFFFPANANNLAQVRTRVYGKRGLLASNNWQSINKTSKVPYSWVTEKISFKQRKNNQNIIGNVYIGQYQGKAFYVITHYPAEYGDGFAPRENIILQNVQISN